MGIVRAFVEAPNRKLAGDSRLPPSPSPFCFYLNCAPAWALHNN